MLRMVGEVMKKVYREVLELLEQIEKEGNFCGPCLQGPLFYFCCKTTGSTFYQPYPSEVQDHTWGSSFPSNINGESPFRNPKICTKS